MADAPLAPYRVLDLTDERGLLAGQILAKLGADVIQVEPPGGSRARRVAPVHDQGSFFWGAYAAGKRGITCNLDSSAGRELLLKLAATADFLFESHDVGVMERRGLDWRALSKVNPRLIYTSITAFGDEGPKATYVAEDLTVWAAGGALLHNRDADGLPLRISAPQAYLHAAADAAGGALIALAARRQTGLGQHVVISAQISVAQATLSSVLASTVADDNFSVFEIGVKKKKKSLDLSGSGARTRRSKWQVADGLVELHLAMGPAGWSTNNLFAWMRETGALPERFHDWDWRVVPVKIESGEIAEEDLEAVRASVAAFLRGRTKREILEQAITRKIVMGPIATIADLLRSEQLAARSYFQPCGRLTLPGPFAAWRDAFAPLRAAPTPGEHNEQIYGELGVDSSRLAALKKEGVV